MVERWCIVGEPRCGSHWLQSMLPKQCVLLDEITNYDMYTNAFWDYIYDNDDFVKVSTEMPTEKLERQQFMEKRAAQIKKINPDQSLVAIVFCNESRMSYDNLIQTLEDCGFRFLFLERNMFDRALSHVIANTTKIAHRYENHKNPVPADALGKITVQIDEWIEYLFNHYQSTEYRKHLFKNYKHLTVRYEHLLEDCLKNKIPIHDNKFIQKTWAVEYKDAVTNFNELLDIYNGFIKYLPLYMSFLRKCRII